MANKNWDREFDKKLRNSAVPGSYKYSGGTVFSKGSGLLGLIGLWKCSYCKRVNPTSVFACKGCGSGRL